MVIHKDTQPKFVLHQALASVENLQPLPALTSRILAALEVPTPDPLQVRDLIALDPGLAALVQNAGSPASASQPVETASLLEAIENLGFRELRALLICTVVVGPLSRPLKGYRLANGELWDHSLAAARLAHGIAQALEYPTPEDAYAAGLLHDIGKLLLDPWVQAGFDEMVDAIWKHKRTLCQAEELLMGVDHAQVGGMMAARWGFPAALVEAIRCHHAPAQAAGQEVLAAIVDIANALTPPETIGLSSLGLRMVHPDSLRILNLSMPALERLRQALPAT